MIFVDFDSTQRQFTGDIKTELWTALYPSVVDMMIIKIERTFVMLAIIDTDTHQQNTNFADYKE